MLAYIADATRNETTAQGQRKEAVGSDFNLAHCEEKEKE